MFFRVDDQIRRQAKSPHELSMINLLLFNLLMLIALLGGSFVQKESVLADYRLIGVLLPLLISIAIVVYTFVRANKPEAGNRWFITVHWRLTGGRYKILLIAYVVGAALIGLGWLLAQGNSDPRMAGLMFVALQRVAIAPMLITLMVLIMLESGALYQAGRGEVPNGIINRFPPPPELKGQEQALPMD